MAIRSTFPFITADQYPTTDLEKKTVREKFENPTKKVLCPRCGRSLEYKLIGNSESVECPLEGCLYSAIRGI